MFKKLYNIEELNAIKTQYEEPLNKKEILVFCLIPAVYIFCFLYFLFYNLVFSIISGLVASLYGLIIILPKMIARNHYIKSQNERNRFMNSLTQNLINDKITTTDGLEKVSTRLNGELSKDIEALVTELRYSDETDKMNAYKVLTEKYKSDRIFVQYIDQLQTATMEGRNNIDELDSLASYHDLILAKQDKFFSIKNERLMFYTFASVISIAIAITLAFTTWNYGYQTHFVNGIVGWIIGGVFILINIYYSHKFILDYFDDEIMEVRK